MSATQNPGHPAAGVDRLAKRLQRLMRYSSLGLLNQADERRFQSLCEELRTLSDLIDRFEAPLN